MTDNPTNRMPPGTRLRRFFSTVRQGIRLLDHEVERLLVRLHIAPRLVQRWLLAIAAVIVFVAAAVITDRQIARKLEQPRPTVVVPATLPLAGPTAPPLPSPTPTIDFDESLVTFDTTRQYAFPIAADPGLYTWTHYHWDDTNAADLEARFGLSREQFEAATTAPVVAITNGVAVEYSGNIGGKGYMLHGDDGLDYYYGHMSELWVPNGQRVTVGQPLGVIGNTGTSAQFIEPHLHLAIGPRDTLWDHPPSINSAERLKEIFGYDWIEIPIPTVEYSLPRGAPIQHPDLTIVTPYNEALATGLAQPALEFGFVSTPPDGALDVIAPLSGEVNVIRWTATYGTRIQITNRAADVTVVISGVDDWLVEDGAAVQQGQVIAHWTPSVRARLHYMLFEGGVVSDPSPTLG